MISTPNAEANGLLNTLNAYTCPMHICTAIAAGGTNQRLNPDGATVRSRLKKEKLINFGKP